MCDPVSMSIAAGVGGVVVSSMMAPKAPQMPAVPEAPPKSQASKAPTASTVRSDMGGTGQAGGAPGVAQTMLAGPGGVSLDDLKLGKSTLLGG